MRRRICLTQIVLVSLVASLATSCVTPPAAGPQVMVTRVPLDLPPSGAVKVASAGTPSEIGDGVPPVGPGVPRSLSGLTATITSTVLSTTTISEAIVGAGVSAEDIPHADQGPPTPTEDPNLRPLQRTQNILLLGTDQRDLEYIGRTDTIMVLSIDQASHRAALISFPRDVYLPIPGVGYNRINVAYPFGEEAKKGGGLPLLMSTIDKNFGIPIDNYVRIDFSGFEDVIDALGGVDVVVDCPLYDELIYRYFDTYTLEPGAYHMNGEQALYYARSRKTTSDFDRSRRQQRVLLAVRKRVLDGGLVPRVPALWMALRDTVDTNMNPADIAELAKFGAGLDGTDLSGLVIRYPLVTDWVTPQGGMVQLPDLPAINSALDNIWNRAPMPQTNDEEKLCP